MSLTIRAAMEAAEVARSAVRDASIGEVAVRRGQAMALIDGELGTTADNEEEALLQALTLMRDDATLATVYTGAGMDEGRAAAVAGRVRALHPGWRWCVGGQPAYGYVLSVE